MNYTHRQALRMQREVRADLDREDRLIAEKNAAHARKDWPTFWAVKRELEALRKGL